MIQAKRTGARHESRDHPIRRPGPATTTSAAVRDVARRRVAFWLLAFVLAATMLGTTLPTPLYDIYQAQWHFSAAMVTVIFAVYAAGVLAALLLAGRSSDQAGRKPVLARGAGCQRAEHGGVHPGPRRGRAAGRPGRVRAVRGPDDRDGDRRADRADPGRGGRRASLVATAANMGGLGLGPLVAGLFAQYAPHPTTLVFEAYLGVLAAAGCACWSSPRR